MIDPAAFRDLVSGRRRGPWAGLARAGLALLEWPYQLAVRWRNRRYDRDPRRVEAVERPVVSVGNLTLGGTGKTPLVEWIARWLRARKLRVVLISRGYGAQAGEPNDEALELEEKLPDVPHLQNPDRVAAARIAIDELDCELILLDDGFQHRRLGRDLDVVLIDALEPFGYDHVFPRGTLREPATGLRRAQVVVLSRAEMITAEEQDALRQRAARLAPNAIWCTVNHRPVELGNAEGARVPVETLVGQPAVAFCGIGNPAGFQQTLADCGYTVRDFRTYPDHYAFRREDVSELADWAAGAGAEVVLCTAKDLVKLGVARLGTLPLWAVHVGLEFSAGQQEFEQALAQVLVAPAEHA